MQDTNELRLYTFTHFMLSPMAKGIQATHSTVELFNKYIPLTESHSEVLYDWSKNWKTIISLNGGITPDLMELIEFLEYGNCPYPWAYFNEDESLGELVTSISIVLPEKIYNTSFLIRTKQVIFERESYLNYDYDEAISGNDYINLKDTCLRYGAFTEFEVSLVEKLNTYRLAN